MVLLYLIGFVAGLIAGISPCILPVLPVILVAGTTGTAGTDTASGGTDTADGGTDTVVATKRSYRAYAVIGGLILSFSVFTLVGSALLSALGLPQDFLRDAGLVVLGVVALGLIIPPLGIVLERPFARLVRSQPNGNGGAFVLGLGLGAVFVPCAGPVLTAITVVGANHRVSFASVVLTVDFAAGAAVPLLVFALAGQRVGDRVAAFRNHAAMARQIGGVVLLATTALIAFNVTDALQRDVPGYTSVLQQHVEAGSYARKHLASLTNTAGKLSNCPSNTTTLSECGTAPNFKGITAWLNTPGDKPETLAALRGKVVLVDFWTYSCINCQRSLPHIEGWYRAYHGAGLDVVGVSTPEFAFEHVVSNVAQASQQLGVKYPVAVDDNYKTWDAYSNEYWPAEYLIDAKGDVRHVAFGEGDYGTTESLIRQLLVAADPTVRLPSPTGTPNLTPVEPLTGESYVGYDRLQNFAGTEIDENHASAYQFPNPLPPNELAFSGTWDEGAEFATSGPDAQLELAFSADDVYLVLGGSGTIGVSVNGTHTQTITVHGIPRLYTLVRGRYQTSQLVLSVSPGIQAYDFTFG